MGVIPNGASGYTPRDTAFTVGASGQENLRFENRSQANVETYLKATKGVKSKNAFSDFNSSMQGYTESVVSVGTQVNYVQQVIALQSGMGVWETGPDRTGTPSFPFGLLHLSSPPITISGGLHSHGVTGNTSSATAGGDFHNHASGSLAASSSGSDHSHTAVVGTAPPVVNVTATYAPWGNVIFKSAAERKVITYLAYKTGTVSSFNIDVYKLEADGSSSLLYSSPNLAGELAASIAWMQHLMASGSIVADLGDSYDVQFRMTGSGSVSLAGINFPNPTPLPGFRPYAPGSGRNPSTTPAPSSISISGRDAMYTGPTPFVSIGIDVGQTVIPRFFYDNFNRSSLGSRWISYGSIGIADNQVKFTGSIISNTTAAAMYHQAFASDIVEVGFDGIIDEEDVGVGVHCPSGLGNGVWLTADVGGVRIQTGAYGSRTDRDVKPVPGSGRYTLRAVRDEADTHFIYQGFFGDPNTTSPVVSWADTGNTIPFGTGRRWWGMLVRRNGIIYPSGRLDNVTAADVTVDEETP